jgi:hypothetical protein
MNGLASFIASLVILHVAAGFVMIFGGGDGTTDECVRLAHRAREEV